MSNFFITLPESTINYVGNPSLEAGTTGWSAFGAGSVAQSSTRAARGRYSLAVTPSAGTSDGGRYSITLSAATQYTASFWAWTVASVPMQIIIRDGVPATLASSTFTGDGAWTRYSITFTTGANTSIEIRLVKNNSTSVATFYIDALQVEQKGYYTDYCDGDQPGCRWRGTRHGSTSLREASWRRNGREYDLTSLGITGVVRWSGLGAPPYKHTVFDQPSTGKYLYSGSRAQLRPILLELWANGTSVSNLLSVRSALVAAVLPDALARPQEFTLRTDVNGTKLEIPVIYEGGLEHKLEAGFHETIALRLLATEPHWRALLDSSAALDPQDAASVSIAIGRVGMHWDTLGNPAASAGGGGATAIYAVKEGPDGKIYVAGDFVNFNGIAAADYVAVYDPVTATWAALSAGGTGPVYALAFDALGNLYIGGNFVNWNAIALADYVVKWTGSAYAALGNGLGGIVRALAVDGAANLWATGAFLSDSTGVPNLRRIAYWDGTTWTEPGQLTGGDGYALAVDRDGSIFVGGDFTAAGGVTDTVRIARWTGSAFEALGTGIDDNGVDALAIGLDGLLYVGGDFTGAGGVDANGLAVWNRAGWSALSSGVAGGAARATELAVDPRTGNVYAGGSFTSAGGLDIADAFARWSGQDFVHVGVNLPGSAEVSGIAATSYGDLYIGYDVSGSSYRGDGTATVTNGGTAPAYPTIVLVRSGGTGTFTLQHLYNATTGHELFFDFDLLDGERLTIDLAAKTITSSFRGDCQSYLKGASQLAAFCLQPGANTIGLFVDGASASSVVTAYCYWRQPQDL